VQMRGATMLLTASRAAATVPGAATATSATCRAVGPHATHNVSAVPTLRVARTRASRPLNLAAVLLRQEEPD
jgi:hypothetical protein